MSHKINLLSTIICAAAVLLVLYDVAYAYIDPGTGSFILQAVLASLIGGAFAVKLFWRNITGGISRALRREKSKRA